MTAAESGKHLLNLLPLAFPLESQRQEAKASRPAFEMSFERLEPLRRERKRQRLLQEGGHFLGRKAQVGGVNLCQLTTGTPASQRQSYFGPCEYDQVKRRWKMIDEICQRLMNLRGGNDMIIVNDQQKSRRLLSDIIQERGEDRFQEQQRKKGLIG